MEQIKMATQAVAYALAHSLGLNGADVEKAIAHCGDDLPCIEKFLNNISMDQENNNKTIEDALTDLEKILRQNNEGLSL